MPKFLESLFKTEVSRKGPQPIVGLEIEETDSRSDQAGFDKFADIVNEVAQECGCRSELQLDTISLIGDQSFPFQSFSEPITVKQIVVSPIAGQSMDSFKQALSNITIELTNPRNIKDSTQLADFAARFTHQIQKAIR